MSPQARDAIGLEPVAASRRSSLSIENARDHSIRGGRPTGAKTYGSGLHAMLWVEVGVAANP